MIIKLLKNHFIILRVHSSNQVFDYETQYGVLTMSINFILFNGSDETHNMHKKVYRNYDG